LINRALHAANTHLQLHTHTHIHTHPTYTRAQSRTQVALISAVRCSFIC